MMTLRRKMAYQIGGMIVALMLISAAALWGIRSLRQDFGAAIEGHRELGRIYEARRHIATARTLVTVSAHGDVYAMAQVNDALDRFEKFSAADEAAGRALDTIRAALRRAMDELKLHAVDRSKWDPKALAAPLDEADAGVAALVGQVEQRIHERQQDADRKTRTMTIVMSVLSLAVILAGVAIGVRQYRAVVMPLRRLGEGVRRVAMGDLHDRVQPVGSAEFVTLAHDFNRMATELEGLYRELEKKVSDKSRELVRSERLASVGYLAAGVAHEINNPIGIIAGYAEFSLQRLREQPDSPEALAEASKALGVIAEEAFRCKQIVQKLLTLARPGDERRTRVNLRSVAEHVVSTVRGLKNGDGPRIEVHAEGGADLEVEASEGELRQVVLNLTLNALDAVAENDGRVRIELARRNDQVELAVLDTGRGMTSDVLERVFEPFFTAKRGAGQPGTGLGLSITHAIVQSHRGTITAHSDGPGKGSRFVVRLPAAGAPQRQIEREGQQVA